MDTVFEAVLAFKTNCENRCPETCERLSYAYRKFITEKFGQKKISVITKDELTMYIQNAITEKRPRERQAKSFLQMLHGFFRFGYDNHYTNSDVSKRIAAENFYKDCDSSKKEAGAKIFSPVEIHLIRETATQKLPNPRAFMILLAIETGMRAGELCALHWDDISEADIHIHRQQLLRTRNGKREGFMKSHIPRTNAVIRSEEDTIL